MNFLEMLENMKDVNGKSNANMDIKMILISNMAVDVYLFNVINSIFRKKT